MERLIKHVNLWAVILVAVLIGQSLVLAIAVNKLDDLWKQVNVPGREMSFETAQMVHDAIEGVYTHPTVDAATGRVYLPDAKIYLPYSEQAGRIVYEYQPAYNDVAGEITLNDIPTINAVPISFSDVPCLNGMVDIRINRAWSNPEATVKLDDGRTLYMKTHVDQQNLAHCKDMWGDLGPTQMMDLFKQAKSY